MFLDAVVEWVGDLEEQHTSVRWPWRLRSSARVRVLGHDYGHVLRGEDIIELTRDGKISQVVPFFHEPFPPSSEFRSRQSVGQVGAGVGDLEQAVVPARTGSVTKVTR
jgi:hypothetical protein